MLRRKTRSHGNAEGGKFDYETNNDDLFEIKEVNDFIGLGVFAKQSFLPNKYLLEYKGEQITKGEGVDRMIKYSPEKGSFLYFFKSTETKKDLCIDATEVQSVARFVNDAPRKHANCKVVVKNDTHMT